MRHELLEAIVRMAVEKHNKEIGDVSDCVDIFMDHIMKNVPQEALIDPDQFRNERL